MSHLNFPKFQYNKLDKDIYESKVKVSESVSI